ncbi:hypothetical protein GCM10007417_07100 [Glycocaulis alkaliphilus]|nr:hypothetical protein GCM10007417_07100 [Glycocaulis alkaliphilus]
MAGTQQAGYIARFVHDAGNFTPARAQLDTGIDERARFNRHAQQILTRGCIVKARKRIILSRLKHVSSVGLVPCWQ